MLCEKAQLNYCIWQFLPNTLYLSEFLLYLAIFAKYTVSVGILIVFGNFCQIHCNCLNSFFYYYSYFISAFSPLSWNSS